MFRYFQIEQGESERVTSTEKTLGEFSLIQMKEKFIENTNNPLEEVNKPRTEHKGEASTTICLLRQKEISQTNSLLN